MFSHEIINDAVKSGARVETTLGLFQEVGLVQWGIIEQNEADNALRCSNGYHLILTTLFGRLAGFSGGEDGSSKPQQGQ